MSTNNLMEKVRSGHVSGNGVVAGPPIRPAAPRRWGGVWVAGLGAFVVLVFASLFISGTLPRITKEQFLHESAAEAATAIPNVTVVKAHLGAVDAERALPGNAQPWLVASIYARTNGYLKKRMVDIGDHVKEGDLLAEIATPEIDAQLNQSEASLVQARANLLKGKADEDYATSDERRYKRLIGTQAVAKEEYDNRLMASRVAIANVAALEATIKVNEADVQRLRTLQSFQKLTAPFSGVITARNVDPGSLITADNPSTERQLFRLEATDPLRVFVDVPQTFATVVKPGEDAVVFRREEPGRTFAGKVTRTASALDTNTRTLRTEVDVPNPDGALLPGMYLQVKFLFVRDVAPVMIPSVALATRSGGPRVAVLDDQHRVKYRTVQTGRDYGAEIEVMSGLKDGDLVVIHPGDDIAEGTVVEPAPAK